MYECMMYMQVGKPHPLLLQQGKFYLIVDEYPIHLIYFIILFKINFINFYFDMNIIPYQIKEQLM